MIFNYELVCLTKESYNDLMHLLTFLKKGICSSKIILGHEEIRILNKFYGKVADPDDLLNLGNSFVKNFMNKQ